MWRARLTPATPGGKAPHSGRRRQSSAQRPPEAKLRTAAAGGKAPRSGPGGKAPRSVGSPEAKLRAQRPPRSSAGLLARFRRARSRLTCACAVPVIAGEGA